MMSTRCKIPFTCLLFCVLFCTVGLAQNRSSQSDFYFSDKAKVYTEANKHTFVPEYQAPPAITAQQRLAAYPLAGSYVAFSLKNAERALSEYRGKKSWRDHLSVVLSLGGINVISGAVYDSANQDLIIVGRHDPSRQPLTLDDLVVALRACLVHKTWPLVSIDPDEHTHKTGQQKVRFEGGIENTQFGADLLDADYRMKLIGFDLIDAEIHGFINEWEESRKLYAAGQQQCDRVSTRYWFQPVVSQSSYRHGIALIDGNLRIGLFIEVMAAEKDGKKVDIEEALSNSVAKRFASDMTDRFPDFCKAHPSFSRMWGLQELTALAAAIRDMDQKPSLAYWLEDYQVKQVSTKDTIHVVGRTSVELRAEGGAQLTAIAMRLRAGDVSALRDAVLAVRPALDELTWEFAYDGQWIIPIRFDDVEMDAASIAMLYAQTLALLEQSRYDRAIISAKQLAKVYREARCEAYQLIGEAFEKKGLKDAAMHYYSEALKEDNYNKSKSHLENAHD